MGPYRKYQGKEIAPDYFSRLNKVAIDEYIEGASHVRYYYWLKAELEIFNGSNSNLPLQPGPSMLPTTFEGIFSNPELIEQCLQLLRATDPPTISDEKRFIGRSKGVLVVWLNVLESKSMFNYSFINDKERAKLLNANIQDLNISSELFRAQNVTAKRSHESYFKAEIAAIKQ